MTLLSKSFNELLTDYKNWICRNPEKVKFIENYSTIILCFLTGKITKSNIPYDWITLGARLLSFINKNLIHFSDLTEINTCDNIKIVTTVLEYAEICLERTTQFLTGEKGRWRFIVVLQCFKCLVKLTLLLHYGEKMICSPYTYIKVNSSNSNSNIQGGINGTAYNLNTGFILKRSGKVVRMVHSAPPLRGRLWKPPVIDIVNKTDFKELDNMQVAGELLYLIKPIVILVVQKYGYGTWRPWVTSLLMDLISLYLINNTSRKGQLVTRFSSVEREEIGKRQILLLCYLLRSPFYERYTKDRLKAILSLIPVLGRICSQQLEFYLQMYFFLWSK